MLLARAQHQSQRQPLRPGQPRGRRRSVCDVATVGQSWAFGWSPRRRPVFVAVLASGDVTADEFRMARDCSRLGPDAYASRIPDGSAGTIRNAVIAPATAARIRLC
jgi:hypothetical protein